MGCGVSGGEEGARYGPSLMPGGHKEAWPHVQKIFQVHIMYYYYYCYIDVYSPLLLKLEMSHVVIGLVMMELGIM